MSGVIYALTTAAGEVRYVGQTRNKPAYRLSRHIADARRGHKNHHVWNWLRSIDFVARIVVLETAPLSGLDEKEKQWIARMRGVGCRLTNVAHGGCGPTVEGIERMRSAHKGRRMSDEQRAALSRARKSPRLRAQQIERNRIRFQDPAARERMAAATRARFQDPAERAKVAEVNRRRFEDPAARERMRVLMKARPVPKGRKHTEETKEKQRAVKRAQWAAGVYATSRRWVGSSEEPE